MSGCKTFGARATLLALLTTGACAPDGGALAEPLAAGKADAPVALPALSAPRNVLIVPVKRTLPDEPEEVGDKHFLLGARRLKAFYQDELATVSEEKLFAGAYRKYYCSGLAEGAAAAGEVFACSAREWLAIQARLRDLPDEASTAGGVTVTVLRIDHPEQLLSALAAAAERGERYDRVVLITHGRPVGPALGVYRCTAAAADDAAPFSCDSAVEHHVYPRVGYNYPDETPEMSDANLASLQALGQRLQRATDPAGVIYVGSCNAGTDPRYVVHPEKPYMKADDFFEGLRSTIEVWSCVSGRTTLGIGGKPYTRGATTSGHDVPWRMINLELQRMGLDLHVAQPDEVAREYAAFLADPELELKRPRLRCRSATTASPPRSAPRRLAEPR